jgi:hypothetical protein
MGIPVIREELTAHQRPKRHARGNPSQPLAWRAPGILPFCTSYFFQIQNWKSECVYLHRFNCDSVLVMSKNLERDLREAEWELYLLYRAGNVNRDIEARLWSEIEPLIRIVEGG